MIHHKTRKAFESPIYRKSRLAARLILKARAGKNLKASEKALATRLASDPAVTSRLIDQAIRALCGADCRLFHQRLGSALGSWDDED